MQADLTRPIIGTENRTAQEVFDIMCDRIRSAEAKLAGGEAEQTAILYSAEIGIADDKPKVIGRFPLSALTHPAPTHNDGSGEMVNLPDKWHKFAVTSTDYSRPFLLGCYETLDAALKAQGGKPEKWDIFVRYTHPDHTSGEVTEAGIPKSISDAELSQWAEKRADDAGRLARELVAYRRGSLPQDVINLVIAARIVAFEDQSPEALRSLDEASEAFASRVPWDNEPEGEQ